MNKKVWLIGIATVLLLAGGVWLLHAHNKPVKSASQTDTRLDIALKDGKTVSAPNTYLVQPGTRLQFHITSNVLGKVSVPTSPAETITFTKSPLTFDFNAPRKAGSYLLLYQATGSKTTVLLGTIAVRGN